MRIVIAPLVVLMLSGCVSTSVNEFFAIDTAPTGGTSAGAGGVGSTTPGRYAPINR